LSIWQTALQIKTATQYRFYDSLIIAAALRSGAEVLYSEDLQHNRQIEHLQIINPFK
jgi:predicted nucleic acid-binding protein